MKEKEYLHGLWGQSGYQAVRTAQAIINLYDGNIGKPGTGANQ